MGTVMNYCRLFVSVHEPDEVLNKACCSCQCSQKTADHIDFYGLRVSSVTQTLEVYLLGYFTCYISDESTVNVEKRCVPMYFVHLNIV